MKLIKQGKTKDVYDLGNGFIQLFFKDDMTVDEEGNIDPGGNAVGASVAGMGKASLRSSRYFFEKLNAAGIPTHYVCSDIDAGTMTVRPAALIGGGVEIICRLKAAGSFVRRYGAYCAHGRDLDCLVEVSLKDDARGDPFITRDALAALGILCEGEYDTLVETARRMTALIRDDLLGRGLELYDIKYEFGRIGGELVLVDEFSWGVMRVYRGDSWLAPLELAAYFA